MKLNAKTAVITGSSRGIGEAIAIELAKIGYSLVINSRDEEELSISKEEIMRAANSSIKVVTFPGDISQEEVCIGMMATAVQESGRIDVLVNNAGINGPEKNSAEISTKEWNEVLDINLKGCFMSMPGSYTKPVQANDFKQNKTYFGLVLKHDILWI